MYKFLLTLGILSVTVSANAQIFSDWKPGSYYDSTGVKHTGFIAKPANEKYLLYSLGSKIKFRKVMSEENENIKADNIKCLVMGTDSFVVSHDQEVDRTPFLKVFLDKPTKLYGISQKKYIGNKFSLINLASNGAMSYENNVYYTGPDPDHLTKMKRSQFEKIMCEMLSDNAFIVSKIKDGTFRYSDMEDLIESYKTGVFKEPKPIEDTY